MLQFLISYLLLIIAGSFFTLGWFTITRGYYFVNPDGSKEKGGEIFGFWELYFESILRYKRINYLGEQLEEKANYLFQAKPSFKHKMKVMEQRTAFILTGELTIEDIIAVESLTSTKTEKIGDKLYLYNEFAIYRFPDWIRKPISGCNVCMASIYGSIVYFTINSMSNKMFAWADNPNLTMWLMWPAYCISLAFLNKAIGSRFKLSQ